MKSKQDKITLEINKRKIQASMKETPNCFGECLTIGDVYEVLDIQKAKLKEDIEKKAKKFQGRNTEKSRLVWDVLQELLKSIGEQK